MRRRVYLVARLGVSLYMDDGDGVGFQPRFPVRAFARREDAEALCRALEEQARRSLCPFDFNYFHSTPEDFQEKVARLGLPPARTTHGRFGTEVDVDGWWDGVRAELTGEQRAGLWALCRAPVFYEVREMDVG